MHLIRIPVVRRSWAALTAALIVVAGSAAPAVGSDRPELPASSVAEEPVGAAVAEPRDEATGAAGDRRPEGTEGLAEDGPGDDEPGTGRGGGDAGTGRPGDDQATEGPDSEAPVEDDPGDDPPAEEDQAPVTDDPGPVDDETAEPAEDEATGPGDGMADGPVLVARPEVEPTTVGGGSGYLLPRVEGLTWLVDGSPADQLVATGAVRLLPAGDGETHSGRYEVSPATMGDDVVVIAAVAQDGHLLVGPDGERQQVHYAVDLRSAVELVEPEPADGPGQDDLVVVPDVPGQVVLDAVSELVDPGKHRVPVEYVDGVAVVELWVTAAAGYRLETGGVPVETVPGAGARWGVTLTFTDAEPQPDEQDADESVDEAEPEPGFGLGEALSLDLVTIDVDSPEVGAGTENPPGDREEATGATPVEPMTAVPSEPPAEPGAVAEAPAAQSTQRLTESGQEGLDLMLLLGLVFVGGAMVFMGTGRDLFG